MLDLDYAEDSEAETDMNVVMNDAKGFVEVQGTAEGHALQRAELDALLELATVGIEHLLAAHGQLHHLPIARAGRSEVMFAVQRRARRGDLNGLREAQRHFLQGPLGQWFGQRIEVHPTLAWGKRRRLARKIAIRLSAQALISQA